MPTKSRKYNEEPPGPNDFLLTTFEGMRSQWEQSYCAHRVVGYGCIHKDNETVLCRFEICPLLGHAGESND